MDAEWQIKLITTGRNGTPYATGPSMVSARHHRTHVSSRSSSSPFLGRNLKFIYC